MIAVSNPFLPACVLFLPSSFLCSISSLLLHLILCVKLIDASSSSSSVAATNIFGDPLVSCSRANHGMALTGYTRNGYCISDASDYGSHHVCIHLNRSTITSTTEVGGGRPQERNFCHVTGQPDWCSSSMTCHTSNNTTNATTTTTSRDMNKKNHGLCRIQNWCVCEWAFATYIEKAGGCHAIPDIIICDAIHSSVLTAYRDASSSSQQERKKYRNALACITKRCHLGGDMMKEL